VIAAKKNTRNLCQEQKHQSFARKNAKTSQALNIALKNVKFVEQILSLREERLIALENAT
tara:strand:- start:32 stop:211 length:180 start_codon:yes stop_codon:yes gene_type:complete